MSISPHFYSLLTAMARVFTRH